MNNLLFDIRPLALDLIATLVFVVISALTQDPLLATVIAVVAGLMRVGWLIWRRERVTMIQWTSLGVVFLFGVATLATQDPRFMMFKPTIFHVLLGGAMLQRGWMLAYVPPGGRGRIPDAVMEAWGYGWAGLMFFTAFVNLGFALFTSFTVWSVHATIFPIPSKVAMFAIHSIRLRRDVNRRLQAARAAEAASRAQGAAGSAAVASALGISPPP